MAHKIRQHSTRRSWQVLDFVLAEDSGQEILEAAIVLPLLFLILLGIFWFGRAFNISSTLQRAAREAVKTASQDTCATCGNAGQGNLQVATSIVNALQADHLQSANIVPYTPPFACIAAPAPTCTTYQNVQICSGVPLTCGASSCQQPASNCGANPALGVRVSFGYLYAWPLRIANLPAMTLHGIAQSGAEN